MAKPRPGKYDHVLQNLSPLPPEDPKRQEVIDQIKESLGHDATLIARGYINFRTRKEELKAALSEVQIQIDAHEQALTESQEIQSAGWGEYGAKDNMLRLSTGETIRIDHEPMGKVVDKEAFRVWCINNGYERQLQLWPTTTNAICKERLLAGKPEPDGCETFAWRKVVLTKNGAE
jgi:hypothetical protein